MEARNPLQLPDQFSTSERLRIYPVWAVDQELFRLITFVVRLRQKCVCLNYLLLSVIICPPGTFWIETASRGRPCHCTQTLGPHRPTFPDGSPGAFLLSLLLRSYNFSRLHTARSTVKSFRSDKLADIKRPSLCEALSLRLSFVRNLRAWAPRSQ